MDTYYKVIIAIRQFYKGKDVNDLFLYGGCYWLANYLCSNIPGTYIMINRVQEHCATTIEHGLYDITGKIGKKDYTHATNRQIQFMKKNYIPKFNVKELEQYLKTMT